MPIALRVVVTLIVATVASLVVAQDVTMPLAQYEQLRDRARMPEESVTEPVLPVAVGRADVSLRVSDAAARVTLSLDVNVLIDGWEEIPVPGLGHITAVRFGLFEGRTVPEGPALVVRGPRHGPVTVEAALPLTTATAERTTRVLRFIAPAAAAVTGTLHVSGDVDEVSFGANAVATGHPTPTTWTFVAQRRAEVQVQIHGPVIVPARERLPLRFLASTSMLYAPSRTRLGARAAVDIEVQQGRLGSLHIPVPAGLEVVAVEAPEVAGWEVKAGRLAVALRAPVVDHLRLGLRLAGDAASDLAAEPLRPEGALRVQALVAVAAEDDLHVMTAAAGHRDAPPEMTARVALPGADHVRWLVVRKDEPAPRFSIERDAPATVLPAQADELRVDVVVGPTGAAAYQLWVTVRNSGAPDLAVQPPAGFVLTCADRDGEPIAAVESPRGLALPLHVTPEAQTLHLAGLLSLPALAPDTDIEVPLPALSMAAARVDVRLVAPGRWAYEPLRPGASPTSGTTWTAAPAAEVKGLAGIPSRAVPAASAEPRPFPVPRDYDVTRVGWVALSGDPGPLRVRIHPRRIRKEWL